MMPSGPSVFGSAAATSLTVPETCTATNLQVTLTGSASTSGVNVMLAPDVLANLPRGAAGSPVTCTTTQADSQSSTCTDKTDNLPLVSGEYITLYVSGLTAANEGGHLLVAFSCR